MGARATLKDVSRLSGLSTFTVSRALAGANGVSTESRDAVLRAAEEIGYVANSAAKRLRGGTSSTIAVVTAGTSNAYYLDMMNGIHEVARRAGRTVIVTDIAVNGIYDPKLEKETVRRLLEARVAGVVSTLTLRPESLRHFEEWEIPVVFVDSVPPETMPHFPSVTTDNYDAGLIVGAHLAENRLSDWLLLLYPAIWSSRKDRERGIRAAAEEAGASITVVECVNDAAAAAEALGDHLASQGGSLPDVLIAGNNPLLLGALKTIRARDLKIPEDMALICFDDFNFAPFIDPPITVLNERAQEIGRLCADMLVDLLGKQEEARKTGRSTVPVYTQAHQHRVPVELIVRRSCGPRRKPATTG